MEYYSAIKRNEIESFVETWMDLETVIQSEVSQKEKNKRTERGGRWRGGMVGEGWIECSCLESRVTLTSSLSSQS